ncbi:SHM4, partial [Symbiodinium microadriaticum]
MIFFRRDARGFEDKINMAVFPGLQGGPHVHQVAAVATQLKEVSSPAFKAYARQVRANAAALANALMAKDFVLTTGGTVNHLMVWDLRPTGLTGSKMQVICDACQITLNKNTVPGDVSALTPGGVRIGSPALTTRGLKESDFVQIGSFLESALNIALEIQKTTGKKLKAFQEAVDASSEVKALRDAVMTFSTGFPMPGFD